MKTFKSVLAAKSVFTSVITQICDYKNAIMSYVLSLHVVHDKFLEKILGKILPKSLRFKFQQMKSISWRYEKSP